MIPKPMWRPVTRSLGDLGDEENGGESWPSLIIAQCALGVIAGKNTRYLGAAWRRQSVDTTL